MDSVIAFFMLFFLTLGLGAVALVLLEPRPGQRDLRRRRLPLQRRPRPRPGARPGRQLRHASTTPAKWVCSFLMLVGRLEIMTAYVLFTAAFWRA